MALPEGVALHIILLQSMLQHYCGYFTFDLSVRSCHEIEGRRSLVILNVILNVIYLATKILIIQYLKLKYLILKISHDSHVDILSPDTYI